MLDTIESAIDDIKKGKLVIVVDDEDRENEGDFITAAANVTPEVINFMSKHGRGLICAPMVEVRCDELGLELMVNNNTALHETAFTVSVDLLGHGCTTGISAHDRAKTVQSFINKKTKPYQLGPAIKHPLPNSLFSFIGTIWAQKFYEFKINNETLSRQAKLTHTM